MDQSEFDRIIASWKEEEVIWKERETALHAALVSANDACRSALAIAKRDGRDTNWEAFRTRLQESLALQHPVLYGRELTD